MGKITWEDRIVIKTLRVKKNWSSRRFLKEFASKAWCRSSLDRLIKTIRRSCWSGAHCPQRFIDGSINQWRRRLQGSYRRMVNILNTSSTGCRHLSSSIVVCCRRYKRWTICRSATYGFFPSCLRQSCWSYVAPSSVLNVYYDKFASHHLLLYIVYMCQKSLNFTNAFKCYQRKCKWLHFSWATL